MSLGESDTRAKLIDPALHACGWTEDLIRHEETAGAVEVVDGQPRRRAKGRMDYTLRVRVNQASQPVAMALIEAKAEHLQPAHGLEQAKAYAACRRLNVQFVFSSNDHLFVEFDRATGLTTKPRPLNEFPTPVDLHGRYEQAMAVQPGVSGGPSAARALPRRRGQPLLLPGCRHPRRARKARKGEERALLSLATGAGKTRIAVFLLKRIAEAGQLNRALFLCDRDELRSQGLGAFQNIFGAEAAEVSSGKPQKNARILIATYQTLDVDTEEDGWRHELLVEAIQNHAGPLKYRVCFVGERACPPEDCGGPLGYANLLDVLRDRTHPEHQEMLAWVGRGFDPERFNLAAVNRKLKLLK